MRNIINIIIKLLLISGLFWAPSLGAIKVFVNNYTKNNVNFYINNNEHKHTIYPKPDDINDNSKMVTIENVYRIDSLTAEVNGEKVKLMAPPKFDQGRTSIGVIIKRNITDSIFTNGRLTIEAGW